LNSFQKLKTPNSRLAYRALEQGVELDLNDELMELESLIKTQTRFQWAHSHAYCYFFKSGDDPQFSQTTFWLGREVIGAPNEDFEGRFTLQDLDASQVLSFDLQGSGPAPLWTEVLALERKARAYLLKEKEQLAPTWRLEWDLTLGDPLCRLQFFRA
jgi:hypothetical protein